MKHILAYLDDHRTLAEARAWVNHNGLPLVADCIYRLNRFAPDAYPYRSAIYQLKNRFVRQLYLLGLCQSASLQRQHMVCWSCGGTGEFNDWDECRKCDGTGVYATHTLYKFVFNINGHRYSWHQPERLVDWPVALTTPDKGEYLADPKPITLDREQASLYMAAIYVWLRSQGIPARELPAIPSLRSAIRQELFNSTPYQRWLSYRNRIARRLRRIQFALISINVIDGPAPLDEDEIPF